MARDRLARLLVEEQNLADNGFHGFFTELEVVSTAQRPGAVVLERFQNFSMNLSEVSQKIEFTFISARAKAGTLVSPRGLHTYAISLEQSMRV